LGEAVPNTTGETHGIRFKLHPRSAPVAETSASEIRLDILNQKRDTRGEALKDTYEFRTVRLTRCYPSKHCHIVP
jgi:hypothetical protein